MWHEYRQSSPATFDLVLEFLERTFLKVFDTRIWQRRFHFNTDSNNTRYYDDEKEQGYWEAMYTYR